MVILAAFPVAALSHGGYFGLWQDSCCRNVLHFATFSLLGSRFLIFARETYISTSVNLICLFFWPNPPLSVIILSPLFRKGLLYNYASLVSGRHPSTRCYSLFSDVRVGPPTASSTHETIGPERKAIDVAKRSLSGRFRRAGFLEFFVAQVDLFASYSKFSGQALAIILEMQGRGAE